MNKKILFSFLSLLLIATCLGQFKSDVQRMDFPQELEKMTALESRSLFDPARLTMNHSFSMSMVSSGGMSMGLGAYTNNMTYLIKDNLRLNANFTLLKSSLNSNMNSNGLLDNGQVYYGAELEYRPTKNTVFQIGFQKSPAYYHNYRPLFLE